MKTVNFSANNGQQSFSGTLIIGKTRPTQMLFESDLPEFSDQEIKTNDIKDVGNFIGSFIARLDVNDYFDEVIVDSVSFPVLRLGIRPADQTMDVVLLGDLKDQMILPMQQLNLKDMHNKKLKLELSQLVDSLNVITVPNDFAYVRDINLNALLRYNVMPANYNRTLNEKILKALKEIKRNYKDTEIEYFYLNCSGSLVTHEHKSNIFVIPTYFKNISYLFK